jgi:hypothetical protein
VPALPTGRLWPDDAAQSVTRLAHYRFIAAVMGVRNDVAEYGCASPDGTRLASEQFRKLTVFDPRASVVSDLQWRFQDNWRLQARQHDIFLAPLPRQTDSIYCVDFIKYLSWDEADVFLRQLRDSLTHDFDVLLIGCPSYGKPNGQAARAAAQDSADVDAAPAGVAQSNQSDFRCRSAALNSGLSERPQSAYLAAADASLAPDDARIYRRTGAELKALMERFFQNVFVFSMVDDVARPGIAPDAQHVFALGSGKKS